jgi:hypothetical protein
MMELAGRSLVELEAIYCGGAIGRDGQIGPPPLGNYQGRFLGWIENRGSRRRLVRVMDTLLFERTRFGVDFSRRLWWFVRPELAAGRFTVSGGPSRWRETETFRLEYQPSWLPGSRWLYDEVKPLGENLCLGIGGLNADRGEGDHFFFALERL